VDSSGNNEMKRITDDFDSMIKITIFNSLGFFFLDLWMFALFLIMDVPVVTTAGLILTNFINRVSKSRRGKIFRYQSTILNFGAIIRSILGGIVWDLFGSKSPFIVSRAVELALIPLFMIAILYLKPHLAESLKVKKNAKRNS
jgi:MFS family permease